MAGLFCRECGLPMFIEDNGVSHHWAPIPGAGAGRPSMDDIGHDLDRDHVALADEDDGDG